MFLSEHARQVISQVTGPLVNSVVIPHGIDERFRGVSTSRRPWPKAGPIRCLYVSNTAPYKHQWHVVKAVADLRQKGYELELNLVGGGSGRSLKRLMASLNYFDPHRDFVKFEDFVPNERIPSYLAKSDLFIFASSCENLPVTMLEAMASGIPICSSNRGPMPEVLGKNGCYFDPECPATIAEAILSMIIDDVSRVRRSEDSLERSQQYTWQICGINTWQALVRACQKDWK
jgi:glycosyltransferase involved in cell wall biosynthesis